MKKILNITLLIMCVSAAAFASRTEEVTVLLIPREDGALRVGMDIANRYPTLLLSYKAEANGSVSLHGWNGKEWVNISLADYHEGNFFKTGPDSALVVEQVGKPVPELLIPPAGWCTSAYKITTTKVRPMLHLIGQYYDFNYKEWDWFAKNYNLSIDAINPEGLNIAWYHRRASDHIQKNELLVKDDLQHWLAIRHPKPAPTQMEPVAEEGIVSDEQAIEQPMDVTAANPLTNSVPEAVVLGAGDAEEERGGIESDTPASE